MPAVPRRRLIGVSLKMYMGLARTRDWMRALAAMLPEGLPDGLPDDVDLFVIPSFLSLADSASILAGTRVALGAQDVFWEDSGAYTGEVSAPMLAEAGCRFVEIGHAERRRLFGETDADVARKVQAATRAGLVPLLCVGEETETGIEAAAEACARQVADGTAGTSNDATLVIAYEPVWAIGAAAPPPPARIIAMAGHLRRILADRPQTRLIYGGSAGPGLLTALGDCVDGLFLGRFAHDIEALRRVLREAAPATDRQGRTDP
jgi:triosephosphate isomerase